MIDTGSNNARAKPSPTPEVGVRQFDGDLYAAAGMVATVLLLGSLTLADAYYCHPPQKPRVERIVNPKVFQFPQVR